LEEYCRKNGFAPEKARTLYADYEHITERVDALNDHYVEAKLDEEKDYLDHILEEVDPVIRLDEDQRKAVLCDEDYSLVVAGAGAGKTTTIGKSEISGGKAENRSGTDSDHLFYE
jgi:DNA helicase-4